MTALLTEQEAGVKRPNCPWVAEFEVLGRSKYRVSFVVSVEQKNAWLKDNHGDTVDRNYGHLIAAKLRMDYGIDVDMLAPSQYRLVEFRSRAIGSLSTSELSAIFARAEANVLDTAAIMAADRAMKAEKKAKEEARAKAKFQKLTGAGDGQGELF